MPSFGRLALFISFFPQLVAGPILRYRDVTDALAGLTTFRPSPERTSKAIAYVCLGLGTKVLLADTLGRYGDPMVPQAGDLTVVGALYVVFAYSFRIYFDFWGYSLIAIGLGHLFGFDLPRNFDRPYESPNPREFWRRWHVTLSYWIRDYLYLPLGGNRSYARNILIVFALCGLWHGAGWTFVAWGVYHAILVLGYHYGRPAWDGLPVLVQRGLTFVLVSLGWSLFQFDFPNTVRLGASLLGLGAASHPPPTVEMWAALAFAAIFCFAVPVERMAERITGGAAASLARSVGYALLFVAALLFLDRSQTFIYFRF